MMTNQTLGRFGLRTDERCEYLTLAFSPLSAPLRSRWRNNGLSADFLGDYVTTFLPADGSQTSTGSKKNEIRHAVAYIANEFLENAMKYHERGADIAIGIHLELAGDHITISASNGIGAGQAEYYKVFIENILQRDASELLVAQLEENLAASGSNKSCLGLLTMISDYGAELGWRFEVHPEYPEVMTVTTSAILPVKNLPGASA